MVPDDEPLRDRHSATAADSDDVVALFRALGGEALGLHGDQDLVSAIADLALRPPGPRRSLAQLIDEDELDGRLARRVWAGLGFAAEADDLSEAEAEAVGSLALSAAVLGDSGALELARVVGLAARHLAEASVSTVRVGFEVRSAGWAGDGPGVGRADLGRDYHALISLWVPALASTLEASLRRHMAEIAPRAWSPDPSLSVATREAVVGFADLVGFTAWSAEASEVELAAALDRFETAVWSAADSSRVEIVKLIGDEVMFAAPSLDRALALARAVAGSAPGAGDGGVRVGMARGRVLSRSGDLFGPVVNQAARLTAQARPGTALVGDGVEGVDEATAGLGPVHDVTLAGFAAPVRARAVVL